MRLGAGAQACRLFRHGGCFEGGNVVITEVEPKNRMKIWVGYRKKGKKLTWKPNNSFGPVCV